MKKIIVIMTTFICLINTILFNSMIEKYNSFKLENILYDSKSKIVRFRVGENYSKALLDYIYSYKDLSVEKSNLRINSHIGKAVYFGINKYEIPMIEGRFFCYDDFIEDKNRIVIGKNMLDLVSIHDNKGYIKFNGIEYEVIGVMGYKDRVCSLDSIFYINLDGYLNQKNNNINEELIISSNGNADERLINEIKENFKDVNISENNNSFLDELTVDGKVIIIQFGLIIVCMTISIIIISFNYIATKTVEVGIRRLYGEDSIVIYLRFISKYLKLLMKGYLISVLLNYLIFKIKFIDYIGSQKINIESFIITFFILFTFGILSSYIFIKKINKRDIYINIKEGGNV